MSDLTNIFSDIAESMDEEFGPVSYNTVQDLPEAERVMGSIVVAENNISRYKQGLEFVKMVVEKKIARENEKRGKAVMALKPYVAKVIAENKKVDPKSKKSVDLLFGEAGFIKGKDKIEIEDEAKVINACHAMKIKTLVKETPSKKAIMESLKGTGLVIAGTKLIEGEEHFFVHIAGEK